MLATCLGDVVGVVLTTSFCNLGFANWKHLRKIGHVGSDSKTCSSGTVIPRVIRHNCEARKVSEYQNFVQVQIL